MNEKMMSRLSRRTLAALTAVMMFLTMFTGMAFAQSDDWAMLSVTLSWTTVEGNPMYANAMPVTDNATGEQAFWAMVDPSASLESLTVSFMHPNHPDYEFTPASGSMLTGVMDAGSTMDMTTAIPIQAYDASGNPVDNYTLYVSTSAAAPEIAPSMASITVQYVLEDGTLLDSQTSDYADGPYTFTPNSGAVGGYELVSDGAVTVNVVGGVADQPVVTFTYRTAQTNVNITVNYMLDDGVTVLDSITRECTPGYNPIVPESGNVGGYEFVGPESYNVYVDGGVADQPVVTFTYRKVQTNVNITVNYMLDDGVTMLDSMTKECTPGNNPIVPESGNVGGLEFVGPESYNVYVDGGVADQSVVTFTYRDTMQGTVTVNYVDENGNLLDSKQETLNAGKQSVTPNSAAVEGYTITSAESQPVTVTRGVAQPDTIVFTYQSPAAPEKKQAEISIYYQDIEGHDVASFTTVMLDPGQGQTVSAAPVDLMAGYTPAGETSTTINVGDDGVADRDTVTFYYNAPAAATDVPATEAPAQFSLTLYVYYRDANNPALDLAPAQTVTFTQAGQYPVQAAPEGMPAGYATAEATQYVNVDANGAADHTEVVFTYAFTATEAPTDVPTEAPATAAPVADAVITVHYVDTKNAQIIAPQTVSIPAGTAFVVTPDETSIPAGYSALKADAVTVTVSAEGVADQSDITFYYQQAAVETEIPVGEMVQRWGVVNTAATNWRDRTSTSGRQLGTFKKGTYIWVVQGETNDSGEIWYKLLVNGQEGYVMQKYVDVLTQAESDLYSTLNLSTPVPVYTPAPTQAPTEAPTTAPTDVPATEAPTTAPTDVPATDAPAPTTAVQTATPVPSAYYGYAVTNQSVAIRTGTNTDDASFIKLLAADTLVQVSGQSYATDGSSWSYGVTLDNVAGMVPDAALTRITDNAAQTYIAAYNAAHATAAPTASPEPTQRRGYAVAIGNNVYMRAYASSMSDIKYVLQAGDVAYVTGQEYVDGEAWHVVQYQSQWGYIRADLMRMMTAEEQSAYIESLNTVSPTLVTTPQPYDAATLSSYGYVSAKTVNFRSSASTSSTKLSTLKQYAFCLVLGTQEVNGVTWYRVNYGGKVGYISGEYFTQLTISELEDFLTSTEYKTGITNNTSSSTTTDNTTSGSSGITSAEDQTVSEWTNPNSGLNVSYAPFDPYATAEPLSTSTVSVEVSASPEPLETATEEPLETLPVEYPTEDVQGGGSSIGWIIAVIIILLGGAGGAYAYILHKQNRRKAAARAAQRKAAIRNGAGENGNPAAKTQPRSSYAQPRTGTYQNKDGAAVPTSANQGNGARKPYGTTGTPVNPYAPAKTGTTPANPYAPTSPAGTANPYAPTGGTANPYAPTRPVETAEGATQTPYGKPSSGSDAAPRAPYTGEAGDVSPRAAYTPSETVGQQPVSGEEGTVERVPRTSASSYGTHRRSEARRRAAESNPDFAPDDEDK